MELDLIISKGLCRDGSNDVVRTENSSSMVNSSGSFAKRSSIASDVLDP